MPDQHIVYTGIHIIFDTLLQGIVTMLGNVLDFV